MNSERRHELKTNSLAHGIEGFPLFWHKYGTKVLLGVVAVLAIVMFFRFQHTNALQQREVAGESYTAALTGIANLQNLPGSTRDAKTASEQAKQLQTQVETAIQQVLDASSDDAQKAEALVARGNLNWNLAILPGLHSSAFGSTQPTTSTTTAPSSALRGETSELLDKAQRAFTAAAGAPGAKPLAVVTARLGLASIAEQRKQWEEAKKYYDQIREDANTPAAFKSQADLRLDDLKRIQKPALIGRPAVDPLAPFADLLEKAKVETPDAAVPAGPAAPSTAPTTAPAVEIPAATAPAAPTTQP